MPSVDSAVTARSLVEEPDSALSVPGPGAVILLLAPERFAGPRDLNGKVIAVGSAAARATLKAALARHDVRAGRIEEVGAAATSRLAAGEVDAAMLIVTWPTEEEELPAVPVPGFAVLQILLEPVAAQPPARPGAAARPGSRQARPRLSR